MKRELLSLALSFLPVLASTQQFSNCPALLEDRSHSFAGWQSISSILELQDGGILFAGVFAPEDGERFGRLFKVDSSWEAAWSLTAGEPGESIITDASEDANGDIYLVGQIEETGIDTTPFFDETDAWVVKVSQSGELLWERRFRETIQDRALRVLATADGGVLVLGLRLPEPASVQYFLARLDAQGEMLWEERFGHVSPNFLIPAGEERVFLLSRPGPDTEYRLLPFRQQNFEADSLTFDAGLLPRQIKLSPDGSFVVSGALPDTSGQYSIAKISPEGSLLWRRGFSDNITDFEPLPDGGVLVCNAPLVAGAPDPMDYDFRYQASLLSPEGELLWSNTYGGSRNDFPFAVFPQDDATIVLAGVSNSQDGDISQPVDEVNFWLIRISDVPGLALPGDTTICDAEQFLLSVPAPRPGISLEWQDGSAELDFLARQSGQYWVSARLQECVVSDTIQLELPLADWQGLPEDTTLCSEERWPLDASLEAAIDYEWQNGQRSAALQVDRPGIYSVQVETEDCLLQDSLAVSWCEPCLAVPNAFTPNGDGINDFFAPILQCPLQEVAFRIYNRWGRLVFESNLAGSGWDGAFEGKAAPADTYFYMLTYRQYEGAAVERRQGDVTLLR